MVVVVVVVVVAVAVAVAVAVLLLSLFPVIPRFFPSNPKKNEEFPHHRCQDTKKSRVKAQVRSKAKSWALTPASKT